MVALRNARGIAVTIPTDLARVIGSGGLALRGGVSIHVFHAPEPVNDPAARSRRGGEEALAWAEVALRRELARYSSDAVRTLAPTETAEVLRLDLRDLFELNRPGRYRVDVALDDIPTEKGKPRLTSARFVLETKDGTSG